MTGRRVLPRPCIVGRSRPLRRLEAARGRSARTMTSVAGRLRHHGANDSASRGPRREMRMDKDMGPGPEMAPTGGTPPTGGTTGDPAQVGRWEIEPRKLDY